VLEEDRLSAKGAAFSPPLTVFWDDSHVAEKDHHFHEADPSQYLIFFRVHISVQLSPLGLLPR
jgi:hypothetical protein